MGLQRVGHYLATEQKPPPPPDWNSVKKIHIHIPKLKLLRAEIPNLYEGNKEPFENLMRARNNFLNLQEKWVYL